MRTTLKIDDAVLARGEFLTGHDDIAALVHEALTALIERESGRRLAPLGGTEPQVRRPPRRYDDEISPTAE